MGQTQLQKGLLEEAVEYLECAISKLFLAGHPTEPEAIDLLIVASQWSGVACIRQEKWEEGIAHLERIGNLKEPEEPKSKAHYYDGLVVLARYVANITFLIFATSPSIINLLTVSNIIDIIYVNCYELKKKRFASCFFGFSVLYVMLVAMLKLRSICV